MSRIRRDEGLFTTWLGCKIRHASLYAFTRSSVAAAQNLFHAGFEGKFWLFRCSSGTLWFEEPRRLQPFQIIPACRSSCPWKKKKTTHRTCHWPHKLDMTSTHPVKCWTWNSINILPNGKCKLPHEVQSLRETTCCAQGPIVKLAYKVIKQNAS